MRTDHVHTYGRTTDQLVMSRWFPAEPRSVSRARRLVEMACVAIGVPSDDLVLLISELGTNVVEHTKSERFGVACVMEAPDGIRVEVWDSSDSLLVPRDADVFAEQGRGLLLLALLAEYHVERLPDGGKVVCFALRNKPAEYAGERESDRERAGRTAADSRIETAA